MDALENIIELFNLPESAIPHSIIAFGYPDPNAPEDSSIPPTPPHDLDIPASQAPQPGFPKEKGAFEPGRIHWEKW